MNKNIGVGLGRSMFMAWEDIDAAVDKWAKGCFGEHASASGNRDETDFEIILGGGLGLRPDDYEKYVRIFDVYDDVKDYEPDDEDTFLHYGALLPGEITKRLMVDVLRDNGLKSYGTALATYDGVFFMELDRNDQKERERAVEPGEGSGWKVEPEVDELVVRMAHYSGAMEARKEIEPMEWDDLCGAIRDAVKEYYDNPSETNPFVIEDIAEKVFRARFGSMKDDLSGVIAGAKASADMQHGGSREVDLEI